MITLYVAISNPTQSHKGFKTITWQLLEDAVGVNTIIKNLHESSTISLFHPNTCCFRAMRRSSTKLEVRGRLTMGVVDQSLLYYI